MKIEKVYAALGYTFKDESLLRLGLSHRSISSKQSNERLEFLGDAALNFVIAAELFKRYPDLSEGDLSRLRSNLVNGDLLAELAREIKLGDYLYLGVGETKSGGGQRSSILADAMEAIIGAVYLDGGFTACHECVLAWYEKRLAEASIISYKDPKTKLQELVQAMKLPLPSYKVIKVEGLSHEQTFYIECRISNIEKTTIGKGTTKRKAEQNAAELFLFMLDAGMI